MKIAARSSSVLFAVVLLVLALAPFAGAQGQDVTPPVTNKTLVDEDGDGFITGAVLTASDPETGVKEIHYFIDGGAEQIVPGDTAALGPFSTPPGVSKTVTLEYFAENNADNQEALHMQVHPVDACPLESALVAGQDADADNDGCPDAPPQDVTPPVTSKTLVDEDGDGFITGATLTATDSESGVKEIHVVVNGGPETVYFGDTAVLGPFSTPISTPATVTLEYFAEDNADVQEAPHLQVHPVDACPVESALVNGQDVDEDNNGCPDSPSPSSLCNDIANAAIDPGIRTSLFKKCQSAADAYDRGQDNAGDNKLGALINELQALRGGQIPAELADSLTAKAQAVISGTSSSTPTGAVVAVGGGSLLGIAILLALLLRGKKRVGK